VKGPAAGAMRNARSCYVDGKARSGQPSVVVTTQQEPEWSSRDQRPACGRWWRAFCEGLDRAPKDDENFTSNPTGKFRLGGPDGACGLTGRNLIVDNLGGAIPHRRRGAFRGQAIPPQVDRAAAYAADLAKHRRKQTVSRTRCTADLRDRRSLPLSVYVDWGEPADVDEIPA